MWTELIISRCRQATIKEHHGGTKRSRGTPEAETSRGQPGRAQAHDDARKIEELYQKSGYPDIKVIYESVSTRDTGKAILKFKVHEGERVFIKQIKFTGNKAFLDAPLVEDHEDGASLVGFMDGQHRRAEGRGLQGGPRQTSRLFYDPTGTSTWRSAAHTPSGSAPVMVITIDLTEATQYKVGAVKRWE